ncbi:hypothetical protein HDV02_001477 [Globomyces sp. JEL0801]|nr:hypothetical protein HDV02_001477 [Globomyces sp. JEL0801]
MLDMNIVGEGMSNPTSSPSTINQIWIHHSQSSLSHPLSLSPDTNTRITKSCIRKQSSSSLKSKRLSSGSTNTLGSIIGNYLTLEDHLNHFENLPKLTTLTPIPNLDGVFGKLRLCDSSPKPIGGKDVDSLATNNDTLDVDSAVQFAYRKTTQYHKSKISLKPSYLMQFLNSASDPDSIKSSRMNNLSTMKNCELDAHSNLMPEEIMHSNLSSPLMEEYVTVPLRVSSISTASRSPSSQDSLTLSILPENDIRTQVLNSGTFPRTYGIHAKQESTSSLPKQETASNLHDQANSPDKESTSNSEKQEPFTSLPLKEANAKSSFETLSLDHLKFSSESDVQLGPTPTIVTCFQCGYNGYSKLKKKSRFTLWKKRSLANVTIVMVKF